VTCRFAEDLTNEEIKKRILKLLETREVMELEGYLKELAYRSQTFKRRIILEMSEIGESIRE